MQPQPAQGMPLLEYDVKIFQPTSIDKQTENDIKDHLDGMAGMGWFLQSIVPSVEDVIVVMIRPRQPSPIARPNIAGVRKFGRNDA